MSPSMNLAERDRLVEELTAQFVDFENPTQNVVSYEIVHFVVAHSHSSVEVRRRILFLASRLDDECDILLTRWKTPDVVSTEALHSFAIEHLLEQEFDEVLDLTTDLATAFRLLRIVAAAQSRDSLVSSPRPTSPNVKKAKRKSRQRIDFSLPLPPIRQSPDSLDSSGSPQAHNHLSLDEFRVRIRRLADERCEILTQREDLINRNLAQIRDRKYALMATVPDLNGISAKCDRIAEQINELIDRFTFDDAVIDLHYLILEEAMYCLKRGLRCIQTNMREQNLDCVVVKVITGRNRGQKLRHESQRYIRSLGLDLQEELNNCGAFDFVLLRNTPLETA